MNVQQQMDCFLQTLPGGKRLLLHSCCGPCSSYVLEYLSRFFEITVLFYNPCIHPLEEYNRRLAEQQKIVELPHYSHPVTLLVPPYEPETFFEAVKGLEECAEGGKRCRVCFHQRLAFTAAMAKEQGFEYFATTLTVSPHKNQVVINQIGEEVSTEATLYLPSDFKKKNGYKRSLELSAAYNLYRQNYCGCIFSKGEAESNAKSPVNHQPQIGENEITK